VSPGDGIQVVRMARSYFGRELLPVHCFAVGDTLVDTGLSCESAAMARFARDAGIRRALLTHYHEDHTGNAALLAGEGVEVMASTATAPLVAEGLPIRFYQHVLWGAAPPARATPFAGDTVRILLCAHRPRLSGGKKALQAKLDWLRGLEAQVRELHGRGALVPEIVARTGLAARRRFFSLGFGDVSGANLVRSILYGPEPRAEVRAASVRAGGER
jgi:hypothetical protein